MLDKKQYHPSMHSAEHILNQTMVRMFNKGRSFSAHIEKKKSKCDYHFNRDLTEDEKLKIETKVNEIIKLNLPVTESFMNISEAHEKFNLEKLPEGAGENIRIIKIGEYDACPCIGEHVKNTGEIGEFRITTSSFNNNVLRLRFKLETVKFFV